MSFFDDEDNEYLNVKVFDGEHNDKVVIENIVNNYEKRGRMSSNFFSVLSKYIYGLFIICLIGFIIYLFGKLILTLW